MIEHHHKILSVKFDVNVTKEAKSTCSKFSRVCFIKKLIFFKFSREALFCF